MKYITIQDAQGYRRLNFDTPFYPGGVIAKGTELRLLACGIDDVESRLVPFDRMDVEDPAFVWLRREDVELVEGSEGFRADLIGQIPVIEINA